MKKIDKETKELIKALLIVFGVPIGLFIFLLLFYPEILLIIIILSIGIPILRFIGNLDVGEETSRYIRVHGGINLHKWLNK